MVPGDVFAGPFTLWPTGRRVMIIDGVAQAADGGWCAFVDGNIVAAGPDRETIRAAYVAHHDASALVVRGKRRYCEYIVNTDATVNGRAHQTILCAVRVGPGEKLCPEHKTITALDARKPEATS